MNLFSSRCNRSSSVRRKRTNLSVIGFALFLLFFLLNANLNTISAQTIGAVTVSGVPVCAGSSVSISFQVTNGNNASREFTTSTRYTVYLSNSSGSSFVAIASNLASSSTPPLGGNGQTATIALSGITIPSATGAGTGYKIAVASTTPSVTINTSTGSPSASSAFTIRSRPTASITSASTSICNGNSTNISGNITASGAWTLTLSNGGGTVSGTGNGTWSKTVSPTSTTTYSISSLSDANCSSISGDLTGSTTITVNARPTAAITAGTNTICNGAATTISGTITATGAWTFTLSNGGGTVTGSGSGTWSKSVSPSSTTSYTISALSDSNCSSIAADLSGSATITVNPSPTVTFTTSPGANTCAGTDVTYTTQSGQSNYVWAVPGTAGVDYTITSGGISSTDFTVTLMWITTGNKTVTVNYSAGGCPGATAASSSTTVAGPPTPTFSTAPGANVCSATNVIYTTQAGQSNYIWSVPGTLGVDYTISSGGIGTSSNTVTLQWLTSGPKTVTVNYSNSCGTGGSPASSSTTVNPRPTPTFSVQPGATACLNSNVTYTTEAGMSSYVWTFTGSAGSSYTIVSGGTSTSNTVTLKWISTGSKTVTVNYTNASGCTATAATSSTATTINALPTITSAATATGVCASPSNQSTPLTYGATSGSPTTYSITWNTSPTNNFVAVTDASLPASPISITVPGGTIPGTYTGNLSVKDGNGCASASSNSFTVTTSNSATLNPNSLSLKVTASGSDTGNPVGSTVTVQIKGQPVGNYTYTYTIVGVSGTSYGPVQNTATVNMATSTRKNSLAGSFTTGVLPQGNYQVTINTITPPATLCSTSFSSGNTALFTIVGSFVSVAPDGTWDTSTTWQGLAAGADGPSYLDGLITIAQNTIVRYTATDTKDILEVDQLVIRGTLIIEAEQLFVIKNGTGTDIKIAAGGKLQIGSNTYTGSGDNGTMTFENGVTHSDDASPTPQPLTTTAIEFKPKSLYRHLSTTSEGSPPPATWAATSTFSVLGYTTATGSFSAPGWSGNLGNFLWNCPSQTGIIDLNGLVTTVQGNLTIQSTGSTVLRFRDANTANSDPPYTLNVTGNFAVNGTSRFAFGPTNGNGPNVVLNIGGNLDFSSTNAGGSFICERGQTTANITGNLNVNSGSIYMSSGASNVDRSGTTLNLTGDLTVASGATLDASDTQNERLGKISFVNKVSPLFHTYTNNGTVRGQFLWDIAANQIVRASGESAFVSLRTSAADGFVLNSGARLILESTNGAGALQSQPTTTEVAGNVHVPDAGRTFIAGSTIEYGRNGVAQFISSGHPSTTGVHCVINNSAGVSVTSAAPVLIGGNLSVTSGNLAVAANDLSVTGTTSLTGGNILLNATGTTGRTLTLTGNLTMSGFNVQVTSGAADPANANLVLYGDYAGTSNFAFSGVNCNVTLGNGVAGTYSRNFPAGTNLSLETLTINRPTATVTVPSALTLTVGNDIGTGLFLNNGTLKMNGTLTVTRTTQLAGTSTLDFKGQTAVLQEAIASNPTAVFSSDAASTLTINGTYTGITNDLYFSATGNTLGTLTLNRSANVTPHVTLQNAVTVTGTFFLTDGEFYNLTGLSMGTGGLINRTPDAAFTALSAIPGGGPYHVIYTDGVGTSLSSAQELQGNLNNVTSNLTGTANVTTPFAGIGVLTVNSGIFTCNTNAVIMGSFVNAAAGTFNAPDPTTFTLTGNFTNSGLFNALTGTVIFDGSSTIGGSSNTTFNNLTLNASRSLTAPTPPVYFGLTGDLNFFTGSNFTHNSGIVELSGSQNQNINALSNVSTPDLDVTDTEAIANFKFYTIRVNKGGGSTVTLLADLELGHLLDIQSSTVFNSNGFLKLLSQTESTRWDASIGSLANGGSVSGAVTIQRFMGSRAQALNRYIAIPAQNVPVTQLQDNFAVTGDFVGAQNNCSGCPPTRIGPSLRWYDEKVAGTIDKGYRASPVANASETLTVGRGYLTYMWNPAAVRWDVSNSIEQGPFTYGNNLLSVTNNGNINVDGWNLIANPFASAIQWGTSGWTRSANISPVIAVPDLGSSTAYPTYYKVWNFNDNSGNLSDDVISNDGWGNGVLPGGVIATGQAFWVHVDSYSTPQLIVDEAAKVSTSVGVFYREGGNSKSEQLTVLVSNGKMYDQSFLKLNPRATAGFDSRFDGYKKKNEEMDVFFVDRAGNDLVMHTLADLSESDKMWLGLDFAAAGEYSISFTDLDKFRYSAELYLVDVFEKQSVSVASGSPYKFAVHESKLLLRDRFYLSRTPVYGENAAAYVSIFPNPTRDKINVETDGPAEIAVTDLSGKIIFTSQSTGNTTVDLVSYPAGVYLFRITDSRGGVVIKKIIRR